MLDLGGAAFGAGEAVLEADDEFGGIGLDGGVRFRANGRSSVGDSSLTGSSVIGLFSVFFSISCISLMGSSCWPVLGLFASR